MDRWTFFKGVRAEMECFILWCYSLFDEEFFYIYFAQDYILDFFNLQTVAPLINCALLDYHNYKNNLLINYGNMNVNVLCF